MIDIIRDQIEQYPFLYDNTTMLSVNRLQQKGKEHCVPLILEMIKHLGLLKMQDYLLELKFEPQPPKQAEDDKKEGEEQEQEKKEGDEA